MSSSPFGNRVRVRVCGILLREDRVLLVNLKSPTRDEPFWSPPGGGVEFGEPMTEALKREFLEETGIHIAVEQLLYVSEFVQPPWHAVECYFLCTADQTDAIRGRDPELDEANQMIRDVQFIKVSELGVLNLIPTFLQHRLPDLLQYGSDSPEWIR